jgi:hypothetical protein
MNLGQMLLVLAALGLLGILTLSTNSNVMQSNETQNNSEVGVTAVSLATSVVEEAMGTMFDSAIGDTNSGPVDSLSQLTPPGSLGHSALESYRGTVPGTKDFNDFDDFNNLFLVYKSDNPSDTVHTPGSNYEFVVPGIRNKYFVRVKVNYVDPSALNSVSPVSTWHKKITVMVTSSFPHIGSAAQQLQDSLKNTLVYPAVMSYWN